MDVGVILAAGKGSRLKCTDQNKTTLKVGGKSLVEYGVDLFSGTTDKTLVVVGAFSESVKNSLSHKNVMFADQLEQKGTGHAAKVATEKIIELGLHPDRVLLGYGDHMMHYQPAVVQKMIAEHQQHNAVITLLTTVHENPIELAWGRVLKNEQGYVDRIVEQKDANEVELQVTELNAGFYCFSFEFLAQELPKLQPSPVTGEYYLTDLIAAANQLGEKVVALSIPFDQVGSGVNTLEQLQLTDKKLTTNS